VRDSFRSVGVAGPGRRLVDHQRVTGVDRRRGLARNGIHQDVAAIDQLAGTRSGPFGVKLRQAEVQSNAFKLFGNRELVPGRYAVLRRLIHTWSMTPMMIRASAMSWLVDRAPPNTKPRMASPRVHSRKKRPTP